jgi:membrane-associated phospholipid phosphatase
MRAASTPGQTRGSRVAAASGRVVMALRHDPRSRGIAVLVALLAADLAALAHIVEDYVTGDPLVRWDVSFASWLYEHSNPTLVDAAKIVTWLGNGLFLGVLVVWLVVALLRRNRVNEALLIAIAFVGSDVVNVLLKLAFHRPRPELAFVHLDTYSFPSGHATGAAAVYTLLAWLAMRRLSRTLSRVLVVVGAALVIVAVGFTRMYLGVHYLSDVLAGTAAGLAWAFATILVATIDPNVLGLLPRPLQRLVLRTPRSPPSGGA